MKILLFRVYQWLIAIPILLLITIITAIVTAIGGGLFDSKTWGYYPPRLWSKCFCALLFVKVKVHGRENISNDKSYVFVANHQGAFDIFSIYGYLNHKFNWMMRKGLSNIPLIGLACRSAGHIMVDHSSAAALKETVDAAKQKLKNGQSLMIFPEGARTWDGRMQPFKNGAFHLAVEFNLPIVPITIDGSYRVLPRTTLWRVTPGKITITIHEPIMPPEGGHDVSVVSQQCLSAIRSSLPAENQ